MAEEVKYAKALYDEQTGKQIAEIEVHMNYAGMTIDFHNRGTHEDGQKVVPVSMVNGFINGECVMSKKDIQEHELLKEIAAAECVLRERHKVKLMPHYKTTVDKINEMGFTEKLD